MRPYALLALLAATAYADGHLPADGDMPVDQKGDEMNTAELLA